MSGRKNNFGWKVIVAAGLVAVAASAALAQPGGGGRGGRGGPGGGMRDMMPSISSRNLDKYADMLEMTQEQRDAAKALFEGYDGQNRRAREDMQSRMEKVREKFQESRDPAVWQDMREEFTKFRTSRQKAEESFTSDLKAILTPAQIEKWPAVERATRRDTTLRRGLMSGERVDLFEIVNGLKLEGEAKNEVQTALTDYDTELDRALLTRNAVYDEGMEKMGEARQNGNMEAIEEMMKKGREASTRVRDVNKRFARTIADLLPEEQKAAFELEVKKASYPDVYRPTQAQRALESAKGFSGLTDEQKEQIEALTQSYSRSLSQANDRLAAAITENEEKVTAADMMARFRGGQEGPVADLRQQRREHSEKAVEDLKKILGPEMSEKLRDADRESEDDRGDRPARRPRRAEPT